MFIRIPPFQLHDASERSLPDCVVADNTNEGHCGHNRQPPKVFSIFSVDPVERFSVSLSIMWPTQNFVEINWQMRSRGTLATPWRARHPVDIRNPLDFILLLIAIPWIACNPMECLNFRGKRNQFLGCSPSCVSSSEGSVLQRDDDIRRMTDSHCLLMTQKRPLPS